MTVEVFLSRVTQAVLGYPKNRLYFGDCVQQVVGGDWINAHCDQIFASFVCKKTSNAFT